MHATYTDQIREIALTAFEVTCYMFPLEEWEVEEVDVPDQLDGKVQSIVRFSGAAEGGMVIRPSKRLFTAIAANMLGIETPDINEKEGALCEIANIICGNTVPLFARNKKICVLRPPVIARKDENTDELFEGMSKEQLRVYLDEGVAEITIYYSAGGDL